MRGRGVFLALVVALVTFGAGVAGAATTPETVVTDYDVAYDHATFWFSSDQPTATFECALDTTVFTACTSPAKYTGLNPASHEFQVRAVDTAGNVDPTPVDMSWTSSAPQPPPVERPANDGFYGAQPISGVTGTVSGSNVNATADWNEPWSPVSGGVSVWYLWTAPRNGSVTFTATPGSSFTPAVTVYIGDAPDHTVLLGSGLVSATFQATQNETYRIAVDGQNGGTGPFDLSWGSAPTGAAANDYFADAQTIDGASGSVSGSTANATVEYGEPVHSGLSCCENPNGHSIWYRWTAPASGDLFLSTEGSSFNTVVAVYAGSSLSGLVRLGGSNDVNPWATWSRAWIRISAGQTYLIAVDAPAGQSGGVQLAWRTTASTGELTAPSVQLLTPPPGANVNGVISFTADAADDQGVDRVEYSISPAGSGFPWYIGEAYAAPYQVAFDTSVLSPGS